MSCRPISRRQRKRRLLLSHAERGMKMTIERRDVHNWQYPKTAFDVVCEVFTQCSTLTERATKWAGMKRTLKPYGTANS